jgi:hypothetical protein
MGLHRGNTSQDVFGDSAYRSAANEATLKARGFRSRIHARATRGRPLSKAKAAANRAKSHIRARVLNVCSARRRARRAAASCAPSRSCERASRSACKTLSTTFAAWRRTSGWLLHKGGISPPRSREHAGRNLQAPDQRSLSTKADLAPRWLTAALEIQLIEVFGRPILRSTRLTSDPGLSKSRDPGRCLLSGRGLRIGRFLGRSTEAFGNRHKDVAAGLGADLNELPPVIDRGAQVLLRELSLGEDQFLKRLGIDDAFGRIETFLGRNLREFQHFVVEGEDPVGESFCLTYSEHR